MPQTLQAKADVLSLMMFGNCVRSEKNGTVVNGLIQDATLGLYRMTQNDVVLVREDWMQCLAAADIDISRVNSLLSRAQNLGIKQVYTGKVLASALFPETFNFLKQQSNGRKVEIRDGVLIGGVLDKSTIQADNGSIIQRIDRTFGPEAMIFFEERAYWLVQAYFQITGFSFNYQDCKLGSEVETKVQQLIKDARSEIAAISGETGDVKYESLVSARIDALKAKVDKMIIDNVDRVVVRFNRSGDSMVVGAYLTYTNGREPLQSSIISEVHFNYNTKEAYWVGIDETKNPINIHDLVSVTLVTKSKSGLAYDTRWWFSQNSFLNHTESGSKGNYNNFTQAFGMVGQQYLGSDRVPATLANGTTTLPHFRQGDRDPITRGLGDAPYSVGVGHKQHYISAVATRKAATSTSTATPQTGYINRKLTKLMENNVAQFDLSVRSVPYTKSTSLGAQVVVGAQITNSSGNRRLVGGPIVQFLYGQMGLAIDKIIKINGQDTFSDINARLDQIEAARKQTKRSRFAYVYFIDHAPEVYILALVSIQSLVKIGTKYDIVVIASPTTSPTVLNAMRKMGAKVYMYNWGDPSFAFTLTEYERVGIVTDATVFVASTDHLFTEHPDYRLFSDSLNIVQPAIRGKALRIHLDTIEYAFPYQDTNVKPTSATSIIQYTPEILSQNEGHSKLVDLWYQHLHSAMATYRNLDQVKEIRDII